MSIIQQGTVLKSEVNQQRYVVHGSLGGGGFGDAYEVSRLDERDQESSTTCL